MTSKKTMFLVFHKAEVLWPFYKIDGLNLFTQTSLTVCLENVCAPLKMLRLYLNHFNFAIRAM